MLQHFFPNTTQPDTPLQRHAYTDSALGREAVKLMVVGSPKGLMNITYTLYRLENQFSIARNRVSPKWCHQI
ncbi:MAG TPA: hypothetical protein DEG17_04335 [Cyanobacteria bacterium UBA11149]|nr:hypothetical protein [Cyanobacteria bacterium UBA11367]HBE61013.1 hypothetical protein [Cyanobacteria bacterium UBA11366]HBK65957.1 hypothetical protein [Cyanobacteria bacterium UBA11166]HBR74291.1 hypothetical protein [Cyanobacteria bacterium UBA11159]HBS69331.1 hypothetical protein [Cyanobacteria bacterium UBA11153]HBW88118.1 hypothetical protein [Cyanobacteria bacterium UBA11149]HCA93217.1 hypothetical protein [Cyanobacteria bacterium UBA9226]